MLASASSCLDEPTLFELVSGSLTPERLHEVEAHVAQCVACQKLVADAASGLGSTFPTTQRGDSHRRNRTQLDAAAQDKRTRANLPVPGDLIAHKYRVERWLGRGGMGSVLGATHVGLDQHVAIKILHLLDADAVARFLREGRTLAQLHSQHIVRVYDSGNLDDATPFIVMEYLRGVDLAERIKAGPLEISTFAKYLRQVCSALETAHAAGIVHRDLKPSNLFLADQPDGSALIKVLDFGISKNTVREDHSATLTTTGAVIGSPRYMSPEQLNGRSVDRATDIWALGVVAYELLTGRVPFDEGQITALLIAIATRRPTPPRQHRADIPSALEAILLRCLEKEPGRRFGSVTELSAALAPFELSSAVSESSSKLRQLSAIAALALALAVLLAFSWVGYRYAVQRPHDTALSQPSAAEPSPPQAPNETAKAAATQALPTPDVAAPAAAIEPALVAPAPEAQRVIVPVKPATKPPPRAATRAAPSTTTTAAKPGPLDTPD